MLTFWLLAVVLALVCFGAGIIFWIWYSAPKDRVAPHLEQDDLKRLETEDRLRQTHFQLLAGFALVLTFILSAIQASITFHQSRSDFELRSRQAQLARLSESLKAVSDKSEVAKTAGYYSLRQLALQDPQEDALVVMATMARAAQENGKKDRLELEGATDECSATGKTPYKRAEADPNLQTPLAILGDRGLAPYREATFTGGRCVYANRNTSLSTLNLTHLFLDNLNLSGGNFDCLNFSQTKLRRVSFKGASLRGADFSGASLSDFRVPGFEADKHKDDSEWKRHRCWNTNFSDADLTGAVFKGGGIGGALFTGANLMNTLFEKMDISRADFTGVRNLTDRNFKEVCGDDPKFDPKLEAFKRSIRPCQQ